MFSQKFVSRSVSVHTKQGFARRRLVQPHLVRSIHSSQQRQVVKPFLLADIGEGIKEVQIIQWFVKPGARVEQFDKICECQSDKASVEITSRFDGVIKKLHYEPDDMAQVGKPLVDIDIQGEISPEDEALTKTEDEATSDTKSKPESTPTENSNAPKEQAAPQETPISKPSESAESQRPTSSSKHASLATPAVRHLIKQHGINIEDVKGSGKDGRVLKEDVHDHVSSRSSASTTTPTPAPTSTQENTLVSLSPVQSQMFKTMTRSLSIPHFLYTDSIDLSNLTSMRRSMNARAKDKSQKLSALAFFLKAISLAFQQYPILNAKVVISENEDKPKLLYRPSHNLGIAVDTPQGLLVPVVKSVNTLSISSIAAEIARLASNGRDNKITSQDLSDGTFTVSNVGSIGGGAVAPVIVDSQVAIVGIGRAKIVPAFDEQGTLIKREECVFSWSADHRIVDGATVARCAELVRTYIENPEEMLTQLR